MGVASWLLILLGPFVGSGPVGGLALAEDRVTVPSCTVVWGGWLPGAGIGDTPAAGGLLRLLWSWWSAGWWVPLARACVRVGGGMLSGFWGSAPWLPGPCSASLFVGGGVWVWVGWL